jgi:hypothetical protein
VITEGAWMQMKKPAWLSMPVLDVRSLSDTQIQHLAAVYNTISKQNLDSLARLDTDNVRHGIDDALAEALKLPDLSPIRELLARDPGLNAKDINPRIKQAEMLEDEDED